MKISEFLSKLEYVASRRYPYVYNNGLSFAEKEVTAFKELSILEDYRFDVASSIVNGVTKDNKGFEAQADTNGKWSFSIYNLSTAELKDLIVSLKKG